jgi:hypothetical protein
MKLHDVARAVPGSAARAAVAQWVRACREPGTPGVYGGALVMLNVIENHL